jgi:hypothetical protein
MDKVDLKKVLSVVRKTKANSLHMDSNRFCAIGHFCTKNPNDELKLSMFDNISFGIERGPYAIAKRFGIGHKDAERLFYHYSYRCPTKANVVKRLARYIERGGNF